MVNSVLELGIYTNIFEIRLSNSNVKIMRVERSRYPSLRELRQELESKGLDVHVYAERDKIYGYGKVSQILENYSFEQVEINLQDTPQLTCRMILDGFIEMLKNEKFEVFEKKGRVKVFNFNQPTSINNDLFVYRGFDLRSIFLLDHFENELRFGLIIDVAYTYRDREKGRLNFHQIVERFGSDTLIKVRQVQGDFTPYRRANMEVSRQCLQENILPFVKHYSNFLLPCGVKAEIKPEPARVILTGEI